MEDEDPAVITAVSTPPPFLTSIHFPTLPISPHESVVHLFFLLNLQKGYYQVPVEQENIQKTAIITPFGMFKFLVMLFGLQNAGNTFFSV